MSVFFVDFPDLLQMLAAVFNADKFHDVFALHGENTTSPSLGDSWHVSSLITHLAIIGEFHGQIKYLVAVVKTLLFITFLSHLKITLRIADFCSLFDI